MEISFRIPEEILHEMLDPVEIPAMALLRFEAPTPPPLAGVGDCVRQQLQSSGMSGDFAPGSRIAVGVGSRGIADLDQIVAALVTQLRAWGLSPFIFPAMGSHGGATAEGQTSVLRHLGVTEDRVGAPIHSSMETVVAGTTPDGMAVHADRLAAEADGIVFVARVKPHTAFRGDYESGLAKMIAIGIGKQAGAAATHARGFGEMARTVPAMARVALQYLPIWFGVAVLENARDRVFQTRVVPAGRMLEEEPELLARARAAMPRLPFDRLDILVVDRIGKNISGDGADPNVTGRYPTPHASGGPVVNKQVVLDLAEASGGNANGLGTADFTTVRAARKMNLASTYPNALTSTVAGPVKLPMVLPSDRLALAAAILTCNAVDRPPRMLRIVDTLRVESFWVSAALLDEARALPDGLIVEEPHPIDFDRDGNLRDLGQVLQSAGRLGDPATVRD